MYRYFYKCDFAMEHYYKVILPKEESLMPAPTSKRVDVLHLNRTSPLICNTHLDLNDSFLEINKESFEEALDEIFNKLTILKPYKFIFA